MKQKIVALYTVVVVVIGLVLHSASPSTSDSNPRKPFSSRSLSSSILGLIEATIISPKEMYAARKLATAFLASGDAEVPADFIRIILPDDIIEGFRYQVAMDVLRSRGMKRSSLTQLYLAYGTNSTVKVKPPTGVVPVDLSVEMVKVLNDYFAEEAEEPYIAPVQLELPETMKYQLNDTSRGLYLLPDSWKNETEIKEGLFTNVYIVSGDRKPLDGYVRIPLTLTDEVAMKKVKNNVVDYTLAIMNGKKRIPVRAYVGPVNQKLPSGHVALPLSDSVLNLIRESDDTSSSTEANKTSSKIEIHHIPSKNVTLSYERAKWVVVFMSPMTEVSSGSFKKLKLPPSLMDDLRAAAIPLYKLNETETITANDMTDAYLVPAEEVVLHPHPPGSLFIPLPNPLEKFLNTFVEVNASSDSIEDADSVKLFKSSTNL